MRAAAILGPGNLARPMATFQRLTGAEWTSLIEQADAAVIFGGDGTIHRHLAELVELEIPVLVVPCGSGNDFARALKIRNVSDAANAWRTFADGTRRAQTIDLGVITPQEPSAPLLTKRFPPMSAHGVRRSYRDEASAEDQQHSHQSAVAVLSPELCIDNPEARPTLQPAQRYFCCVAGVGIDTAIARQANSLPRWIRARGGYALSAPRQILRFAPFPMKVSTPAGGHGGSRPTILAAVANTAAYGGGMKIAPKARFDDGRLDLCVVQGMNAFRLFCLFPTVYFGRHLGIKEVRYSQTECVRIETELPLDVYADGEYVCQTPVEFSVARGALSVLTPQ